MMIRELIYKETVKANGIERHCYVIDVFFNTMLGIITLQCNRKLRQKTLKNRTVFLEECSTKGFRYFKCWQSTQVSKSHNIISKIDIPTINRLFKVKLIPASTLKVRLEYDFQIGLDIQDIKLPDSLKFFGLVIKSKETAKPDDKGKNIIPEEAVHLHNENPLPENHSNQNLIIDDSSILDF